MGKKNKHSKDKLHQTVSELRSHHVGTNRELELSVLHRRLKFDSCCLTLNSISSKPVGLTDDDGFCYIFECDVIVKFLEKFQIHPITGKKIAPKNLIHLIFHKNNEGRYHCPVIYKLFNQRTKIVANRITGHVYSWDAYLQLNLKSKNFKDLLTDEPFEKDDIVTIQDPDTAEIKWAVSNFYYIKNKLKVDDDTGEGNIRILEESDILKSSLEEYKSRADSIARKFNEIIGCDTDESGVKLDSVNSANYSDGALARSVTSTVARVTSIQQPALLSYDQILYPRIKKKGYLQLITSHGQINLELFCDRAPKTCHNFMLLASRGYYDGTIFHRLIKNFIIQGGDPTGTGSGGESAWVEPFKDECHGDLKHSGRGILAMANSGPNTNKSQFYITFRGTWDHLDGKHTVFGRVVGGLDTLDRMEAVEVDKKDRPKKEIKILRTVKYIDPFADCQAAIEEERKNSKLEEDKSIGTREDSDDHPKKKFRSGVGTYIDLSSIQKASTSNISHEHLPDHDKSNVNQHSTSLSNRLASYSSKKKHDSRIYGDFSNW